MPFQDEKGFGPASVWPVEFYAAMRIEADILAEREGHSSLSSPQERGSNPTEPHLLLDPLSSVCEQTQGGDGKEKGRDVRKREKASVPPLSLNDVLSPKEWSDLFSPMPEEALHVGS
jgi:hypothetical protein